MTRLLIAALLLLAACDNPNRPYTGCPTIKADTAVVARDTIITREQICYTR